METLPACSLIWANYTGNAAILALEKCYKSYRDIPAIRCPFWAVSPRHNQRRRLQESADISSYATEGVIVPGWDSGERIVVKAALKRLLDRLERLLIVEERGKRIK
jgi:hypothetical protein